MPFLLIFMDLYSILRLDMSKYNALFGGITRPDLSHNLWQRIFKYAKVIIIFYVQNAHIAVCIYFVHYNSLPSMLYIRLQNQNKCCSDMMTYCSFLLHSSNIRTCTKSQMDWFRIRLYL